MYIVPATNMTKVGLSEQTLYLIIARCLSFALTLLHPVVFVRIFPQDEYGLYRQLMLLTTTIIPLGQLGTTSAVLYFLPREPQRKDRLIFQSLLFIILVAGALCGGLSVFGFFVPQFFYDEVVVEYLSLLSAYCFFMTSSSLLVNSMIAEGKAKLASIVEVAFQLIHSTALIGAALLTQRIVVVMLVLVAFSFLRFVFQSVYLKKRYSLSLKNIEVRSWRRQLGYSIPLGLSYNAWLIQGQLHSYLVSFLFHPAIFAVYSIGSQHLPIANIVSTTVAGVLTPALSDLQKKGDTAKLLEIWHSAIRKSNLLLFPMFSFFMVMADEFIIALFTDKYVDSIAIFRINLVMIAITAFRPSLVLSAYAKTNYLMVASLLRIPLTLMILYLFATTWGILGAISANQITEIVFQLLLLKKAADLLELPFSAIVEWKRNGKILLIASLCGVKLLLLKLLFSGQPLILLALGFVVYVLCYGLLSLLCKTVDPAEWSAALEYVAERVRRRALTSSS